MPEPVILIIDDSSTNIMVAGNTLDAAGYVVLTAMDAMMGISIAMAKKPDVILLDIMMPEIDGFQACKMLKSHEETRMIPVIFLTALNEPDTLVKAFESGGVDYIAKPFNSSELVARVKTHAELKRTRDMLELKNEELRKTLEELKTLKGLLPICSSCKKIRDDGGYWQTLEKYIMQHSDATFTHSLCNDCMIKLYPEMAESIISDEGKG